MLGCVETEVILTLSPKKAPPVNGDVGSTEIIPSDLPSFNIFSEIELVKVDFPTPGLPVIPIMYESFLLFSKCLNIIDAVSGLFSTRVINLAKAILSFSLNL